jgi:hypothetical protein
VTYFEKRKRVAESAAYRRLTRFFVVIFAAYALVMEVIMVRGGAFLATQFFVFSVLYWPLVAALMLAGALLILRFVVPAVMNDAQSNRST